MNPEIINATQYYDPFADENTQNFDPLLSFKTLKNNYEQGKINHDSSADEFVKGAEALWLDSAFIDRFDAVTAIAQQMHRMCGEDHNLRSSFEQSSIFGAKHGEDDGHGHEKIDSHLHDDDDDEDGILGKKKKKKKKK